MQNNYIKILSIAALLCSANMANAHHSFAATFKSDETNTVEGIVTDFRFSNPHVVITLDVTNEDGSTTNWMAEGGAATGWRRAGWANDSLNEGDMLRITGSATHDGSPMVSIQSMTMLNPVTGVVMGSLSSNQDPLATLNNTAGDADTDAAPQRERASNATGDMTFIPATLPTGEPNFSGITSEIRGFVPTGATAGRPGPDGNDPEMPYNAVGEAANTSEQWSIENDPQVFCDPPGLVRQAGYSPYGQKIQQYPDHVVIEYEEYGSRRAIFFEDEIAKPGVPSHLGDSVARYEGDTLVIETVNLLPNLSGHRGKPLSDQTRVLEVYSKADYPEHGTILTRTTTIHDPVYLTESWTIVRHDVYRSDYEYLENECSAPLRERPAHVWQQTEWPE